jgi:hypothetical protein
MWTTLSRLCNSRAERSGSFRSTVLAPCLIDFTREQQTDAHHGALEAAGLKGTGSTSSTATVCRGLLQCVSNAQLDTSLPSHYEAAFGTSSREESMAWRYLWAPNTPISRSHQPGILIGVVALLFLSGCVTVYQPLVGLQRPYAVNPLASNNFEGTRLLVRCHDADGVEADELCPKLRSMFSKQGAAVSTELVRPNRSIASAPRGEAPQFIIDVKSKVISRSSSPISWILNVVSFTLVPGFMEATFGQDVVVRDGEGFILAQGGFQERFVTSFGFGVWALNGLMNWLVRPKDQQVDADGQRAEFTQDFQGHMSQLLYNARVRSRVMHNFEPDRTSAAKPAGAPP